MSLRKYWNAECDCPRHPSGRSISSLSETGGFAQIDATMKRADVIPALERCGWQLKDGVLWCASCVATEPKGDSAK